MGIPTSLDPLGITKEIKSNLSKQLTHQNISFQVADCIALMLGAFYIFFHYIKYVTQIAFNSFFSPQNSEGLWEKGTNLLFKESRCLCKVGQNKRKHSRIVAGAPGIQHLVAMSRVGVQKGSFVRVP